MEKGKKTEIKESAEKDMLRFEIRDLIAETEDIDLLRLIYVTMLKCR